MRSSLELRVKILFSFSVVVGADGKNTRRFPHPPGRLSSLQFSPTSVILMAAFEEPKRICVWRLDTQEIVTFSGDIPAAIIRAPLTSHLFIPQDDRVEIWEVSMTSSHMIFEAKPPITPGIATICPSRDGRRILVGSSFGTVRMLDINLARNQAVTMDTQDDVRKVIAVAPSGKMVVTQSKRSIELRDTNTSEVIRRMDAESYMGITFSPDVLSKSLNLCDINNPENRLSFDPWPTGGLVRNWEVAFQTRDHVVICTRGDDVSDYYYFSDRVPLWITPGLARDRSQETNLFLSPDGCGHFQTWQLFLESRHCPV